MKNKITNQSYGLVENVEFGDGSPSPIYSVRILDKKYKDVIISYGKIGLSVQEDGQNATLSFKFQIEDPAKLDRKELEDSEDFNTYAGDLLSHIIQTAFDTGSYKVGDAPVKASEEVIDVNTTTDDNPSEDRK